MNKQSDMKHARKMVLVPYKDDYDIETYDHESKIKTPREALHDLNIHMKNILSKRSLPNRKKIFLHNQLLRKYMFLKDQLKKEKEEDVNRLIEVIRKPKHRVNFPSSVINLEEEHAEPSAMERELIGDESNTHHDRDSGNNLQKIFNKSQTSKDISMNIRSTPKSSHHSKSIKRLKPKRPYAIDTKHDGNLRYPIRSHPRRINFEKEDEKKIQKGHGIHSWLFLK